MMVALGGSMDAAGTSLLPPFSHIPVASETFEITVPEPFGLTQIRLEFEPGSSKRISVIAISYAGETYRIDGGILGEYPAVDETHFYYNDSDFQNDKLDSFYFHVNHGAAIKVECGVDRIEHVRKMKIVVVRWHAEPIVADDESYFETCTRYTEAQKQFEEINGPIEID